MKDSNLEVYKSKWKVSGDFSAQKLSEDQIRQFLNKGSNNLSRGFKRGLILDVFLKWGIVIYWIGLMIFLYPGDAHRVGAFVLIIALVCIGTELLQLRKIPRIDYAKEPLESVLQLKTDFLRSNLFRLVLAKGLSAPLFIISGMMGWFLHKNGHIRLLDREDFIVLGAFVVLGFILNAFVEFRQQIYLINQLEETLHELQTNGLSFSCYGRQKRLQWRRLGLLVLAILLGVLLLGILIYV